MLHILETIANCLRNLFIHQSIFANSTSKTEEKEEKTIEYLPAEIQHKILKDLNFAELLKIKQTNRHFYEFVNKYKGSLARKRFDLLFFMFGSYNVRESDDSVDFPLSNHLQEKWLSALDKQIPVFIIRTLGPYKAPEDKPWIIFKEDHSNELGYSFKWPLFPLTIDELKVIRYWLLEMFRCVFDTIEFGYFIINPKMIKLLFDNDEINKLKLNCREAFLFFYAQDINDWKFTFDRFVISERLCMAVEIDEDDITEKEINFLLELLLNEGYRIPQVTFNQSYLGINFIFYNHLLNIIETSTDLSKIVAKIEFDFNFGCAIRSKLIIKGVETSESNNKEKCYKITNIYDPKMVFTIVLKLDESESDRIKIIQIIKIK